LETKQYNVDSAFCKLSEGSAKLQLPEVSHTNNLQSIILTIKFQLLNIKGDEPTHSAALLQ